jgi:hypothetical protein
VRRAGLAATLLVVPLLAGCGSNAGKDYCQTVRARQSQLGSIAAAGSATGVLQALPILQELEGSAPGDVQDDYQLVVTRIRALQHALDGAGVDPASYDPKHPPAGLSSTDRARIRDAAAQLAATDTVQALGAIQQEVLDVCHTPLDL